MGTLSTGVLVPRTLRLGNKALCLPKSPSRLACHNVPHVCTTVATVPCR